MLIPIIALIALVGLVVYLTMTKPEAQETTSQVSDVAFEETPQTSPVQNEETFKESQLDALAQAQAAKVEVANLTTKVDVVLAEANALLDAKPIDLPVAPLSEDVADDSAPAPKPKKKRRYYKSKAKK